MSDALFPFQHFPLDHPEYKEQIWLRQAPLSTIRALLEDPHEWIRNHTDRAPEQLLGARKDSVLITFLYPAHAPAEDTMILGGVLVNNIIMVYLPHPIRREKEAFVVSESGEPQVLTFTLHEGLAFACHYPFPGSNRSLLLDYLVCVIQDPLTYLEILHDDAYFRLQTSAPHPGYVVNTPLPTIRDFRLLPSGGSLAGVRFLFQWNRPAAYALASENSGIKLIGTYDRDANGDDLVVSLDSLVYEEERESGPPPPPGLLPTAKKTTKKTARSKKEPPSPGDNPPESAKPGKKK